MFQIERSEDLEYQERSDDKKAMDLFHGLSYFFPNISTVRFNFPLRLNPPSEVMLNFP